MISYEIDLLIERPVDEVYEFFANLEKQPSWEAGFLSIKKRGDGPLTAGSQYDYVHKLPLGKQRGTIHVLECESLRRITMRADGGAVVPVYTWSFSREGDSTTRFHQIMKAEVKGPLKLLSGLLGRQFRRDSERALKEAKRQLESR